MNNESRAAKRLNIFVGSWRAEGQVEPGSFGPGGPVHGSTAYRWGLEGAWLTYTSRLQLPQLGTYEVRGGLAVAGDAQYRAFAFNSMGVLLAYNGRWETPTTLRFDATYPAAAVGVQRVSYERLPRGQIEMRSEKKGDGGVYEAYFAIILTRES